MFSLYLVENTTKIVLFQSIKRKQTKHFPYFQLQIVFQNKKSYIIEGKSSFIFIKMAFFEEN